MWRAWSWCSWTKTEGLAVAGGPCGPPPALQASPAYATQWLGGPPPYQVAPAPSGPSQPATLAWPAPTRWFQGAPSQCDQASLAGAFNTATLQQSSSNDWNMDTGATAHMTSDAGILSFTHPPTSRDPSHIIVGNGSSIPITSVGHTNIQHKHSTFTLRDILCSPAIIKNLISVRHFVVDNWCSVEFDPFGFTVKDLHTRTVIAKYNSSGPLYALHHALPAPPSSSPPAAYTATTTSGTLWHRRLGHLGLDALARLSTIILVSKDGLSGLCHACQLGRHIRLPYTTSFTRASANFELLYCDLWTSPVVSVSGYKYYLVILDDCSHFV